MTLEIPQLKPPEHLGICALCRNERPLRLSHIVPKFASDWIKATSVTKYIRTYIQPNRRMQDGVKARLLCHECEQLLSLSEKAFAERIFRPHLNGHTGEVPYDDFLKRFVVSLAFRTAAYYEYHVGQPHHDRALLRAAEEWRSYLLGQRSSDSFSHHMLLLDYGLQPGLPVPEKLVDYLMRAISFDLIRRDKADYVAVYTKLPGFVFVSCVAPKNDTDFHGTRIHRVGSVPMRLPVAYRLPGWMQEYWKDKARTIAAARPSEAQMALMLKDVEAIAYANPDTFLNSGSFQAHQNVMRLKEQGLVEDPE